MRNFAQARPCPCFFFLGTGVWIRKKKPKNLLETCPFLALLEPLLSLFGPVSLLLRDQLFKAALAACFFPGLAGSAVPPASPELLADGSAVETEALPPRPRPQPTTTNCQSCQRSGVCSQWCTLLWRAWLPESEKSNLAINQGTWQACPVLLKWCCQASQSTRVCS